MKNYLSLFLFLYYVLLLPSFYLCLKSTLNFCTFFSSTFPYKSLLLSSHIFHHNFNITQLSSIPHSQKCFLLSSLIVFLTYPSFFQPGVCFFLICLSHFIGPTRAWTSPKDLCPMLRAVPKILVFSCMLALVVLWSRKITSGPH